MSYIVREGESTGVQEIMCTSHSSLHSVNRCHTHTHENCGSKMRSVLFFFFGAILFYAKMINTHKCSVSHEYRYSLLSHKGLERKRGIYCFNSVSVC